MHKLRESIYLKPAIKGDVSDALLDQLVDTKDRIREQQNQGFKVGVVHLTGDMMHASHIQYMNSIKRKMEDKYWRKVKLLVGVEMDTRTKIRKEKENIDVEQERRYMFENLKSVDKAYVELSNVTKGENEPKPAGVTKYLWADVFITHEEYINNMKDYLQVAREYKKATNWQTMVIKYDEHKRLWEESMSKKFWASTTKKLVKIFKEYKGNPKYDK